MLIDEMTKKMMFMSDDFEGEKKFWEEMLSDLFEFTGFTNDFKKNEISINKICADITKENANEILRISKSSLYGIYMILVSSVLYNLYRHTDEQKIFIAIPNYKSEEEKINKYFPVGFKFEENWNFNELLTEIKNVLNEVNIYENFPIQDYFGVINDNKKQNKQIKTIVSFKNIHDESLLETEDIDLFFSFVMEGNSIKVEISYKESMFYKETIVNISNHINLFLKEALTNQKKMKEIDLLTEFEKNEVQKILSNCKDTQGKNKTIIDLFESQVIKTPSNIALNYYDSSIDYFTLNQKSNQMANFIQNTTKNSIETVVGVIMDNSIEMIISILAIWKSGRVFIPISPGYPIERINFMIKDANIKTIITNINNDYFFENCCIIHWENLNLENEDKNNLKIKISDNSLAYIMYTSGTTDKPKGVMIEHKSLFNTLSWRKSVLEIDSKDTILNVIPFTFDAFIISVFTPLINGSKLILLKNEEVKDPSIVINSINHFKVTSITLVPSLFKEYLNYFKKGETISLKKVIFGGEKISVDILEKMHQFDSNTQVINEYGPTEVTITCCCNSNLSSGYENNIGKPIENMNVLIINKNNKIQPVGIPGEICVLGIGLARGYLNREDLNEKCFVKNMFENERLYKTGDLGRILHDGTIEILGRIDEQVKINGIRIELAEVSNTLLGISNIQSVAVVPNEFNTGLIAFYTSNFKLENEDLKSYLLKRLPAYSVPYNYIKINKIPLTVNGKIDKRALLKEKSYINMHTSPNDEVELLLIDLFSEILNVEKDKISVNDNFSELGATSIQAIQIVTELSKKNIFIELQDIFLNQSPKNIANLIKEKKIRNNADENSILIKLRDGDSTKSSLYLLPPAGGTILGYLDLANSFQNFGNVYALQDPRINGHDDKFDDFEFLISNYVKVIKEKFNPEKDFIGGHSLGGKLAHKICLELLKILKKPQGLIIFDTVPYTETIEEFTDIHTNEFNKIILGLILSDYINLQEKIVGLNNFEIKELILEELEKNKEISSILTEDYLENIIEVFKKHVALSKHNIVENKVTIPITVFTSNESEKFNYKTWENYTTSTTKIINVQGNHITMLKKPNVNKIINFLENNFKG